MVLIYTLTVLCSSMRNNLEKIREENYVLLSLFSVKLIFFYYLISFKVSLILKDLIKTEGEKSIITRRFQFLFSLKKMYKIFIVFFFCPNFQTIPQQKQNHEYQKTANVNKTKDMFNNRIYFCYKHFRKSSFSSLNNASAKKKQI